MTVRGVAKRLEGDGDGGRHGYEGTRVWGARLWLGVGVTWLCDVVWGTSGLVGCVCGGECEVGIYESLTGALGGSVCMSVCCCIWRCVCVCVESFLIVEFLWLVVVCLCIGWRCFGACGEGHDASAVSRGRANCVNWACMW